MSNQLETNLTQRISASNKAKKHTFMVFADFFKEPSKDFYAAICSGHLDHTLCQLLKLANYPLYTSSFQTLIGNFDEMNETYRRHIAGLERPFALPVESLYKEWTNDPSARSSIARSKGYLMGDSAMHIRALLDQLGIEIPEAYKSTPDHLAILLELLSFMFAERRQHEVHSFITDHFDWLDNYLQCLNELPTAPYYSQVISILMNCVASELTLP